MGNKHINAFTLSEILITLGIIGIVAVITIPSFVNAHKAAQYKSQFLKSYSALQQALILMENEGVSTNINDYRPDKFAATFINYFKKAVYCGNCNDRKKFNNCWDVWDGNKYLSLSKNTMRTDWLDDGQILLPDGTNIYVENLYKNFISVDINGYSSPPNRWGIDLFTFELINGKLLAVGALGTSYTGDRYCSFENNARENGITCSYKALQDPNYFKKLRYIH